MGPTAPQRHGCLQANQVGEMIVDAAGGVVERGVRAADCHPGASQSQQHAAIGAGVVQALGSLEQDRMVADDQLGRCLDGLSRAAWGHGEASHEPLHGSLAFSEEQSGIVPVRGEFARRELLQVFDDGGNGKHGTPPDRRGASHGPFV